MVKQLKIGNMRTNKVMTKEEYQQGKESGQINEVQFLKAANGYMNYMVDFKGGVSGRIMRIIISVIDE